ncbi:MAG: hypothetical protein OFPII_22980 [Osedax symbiont Rs1]|nr:MAG: hypothetical protein OFPII_22980 [Osedax symbiont Rs1]
MSASRKADIERIQQAAVWMARLWSDQPTEREQQACNAWRKSNPANEKAWQCTVNAQASLARAPANSGHLIARSRALSRRNLLGLAGFAAGGLIFSSGYLLRKDSSPDSYTELLTHVELSTATGELKKLSLSNNNQLVVNTATDISMPATNLLVLSIGEIWLENNGRHPLQIKTPSGTITHHGGQLSVRHTGTDSQVSLFNGKPASIMGRKMHSAFTLNPTQKINFTASKTDSLTATNLNEISWLSGKLVVQDMPLTEFVAELSRYRKGVLRIAPELSHLAVTGAFSLKNTDLILQQLQASLPIKVKQLTRYWVNICAV